ncbi:ATP-dependent DNA helicase [Pseudactinotalea sp. Z1748]|uniref:ATP-dependent DNA helicase n=1 Tax=Pseudactinotalea sp. Z1748 TaxID=3413027 RepID=UPI003C7D5AFD
MSPDDAGRDAGGTVPTDDDVSRPDPPSHLDTVLDEVIAAMGGARREGQHQMATEVAAALAGAEHLLVQAGTGTGKSLAYLIPALLHAVSNDERTIISTATLALQRQVLGHDLPLAAESLRRHLPREPQVALLKGWHNYLCLHKVAGGYPSDDEGTLFDAAAAAPSAAEEHPEGQDDSLGGQVLLLRRWAEETSTGDRDDLVPGVSDRAWRQVSLTSLECLGQRCPLLTDCFPEHARRAAREADLVVTNHAMLGIAASGSPKVLPEHQVLIVDEAHELADRVTAQATVELSAASVERTARLARRHAGIALSALEDAATHLRTNLGLVPEGRLPQGLPAELVPTVRSIAEACREAMTAVRTEQTQGQGKAEEAGGRAMATSALLVLFEIADRLLSDSVAERIDVLWCERGRAPGEGSRLKIAPLDVAGPIASELFAERAAVLTSATLALGGTFDHAVRSVGMGFGPHRAVQVSSPFDYGKQGILYVASHLPPPGRDGTAQEALDELAGLIEAAGGRTLGLFSSRRGAQAAAEALRERLDTEILLQGEDSIPALVRRFSAEPATSLFGTLSLWQGVDVPGEACQLVVIDRIPFPRPDDPIRQARQEVVAAGGGNGFMAVAASHAALLLAQGAGRLVRGVADRGVVAVLDPRLRTARYGSFLAKSLPPLWPTTDGDLVRAALRRLSGGGEAPA